MDETEEEIERARKGTESDLPRMFYCTAHSKGRVYHQRRLSLRLQYQETSWKGSLYIKTTKLCLIYHLQCDYFKRETVSKIQLATSFLDRVVLCRSHLHINFCPRIGATSSDDPRMTLDDVWMCSCPYSPHPCNLTKRLSLFSDRYLFPQSSFNYCSLPAHILSSYCSIKIAIFLSVQANRSHVLKPQFPNYLLRRGVPTNVQRESRISRNKKDIQSRVTQMRINAMSWQLCCAIRKPLKKALDA